MAWDTDKIIGAGLICALLVYILGVFIVVSLTGHTLPLDVAGNIVTGLAGYMGRTLLDKKRKEDGSNENLH